MVLARAAVRHYQGDVFRPKRVAIGREIPPISEDEYRWTMAICAVAGVAMLGIIAVLLAAMPAAIALALTTTNREKQN